MWAGKGQDGLTLRAHTFHVLDVINRKERPDPRALDLSLSSRREAGPSP